MCPKCREPLIVVAYGGVEVDCCAGCGGVWLDAGEVELIAELAGAAAGPLGAALCVAGSAGKHKCPRCGRKMHTVAVGSPAVEIDRCPVGDGVWLDDGELAALVRRFGGAEAPEAAFLGELFRHKLAGEGAP